MSENETIKPEAAVVAGDETKKDEEARGRRKLVRGVVIGDRMDKTVRVAMHRRVLHPVFKKFVSKKKTFIAHDEKNECKVGDQVLIVECRPLSKTKHWRVKQVLVKAQ